MARSSENYKVHYIPRNVLKPPEELQRLIFPFIEKFKISLNDLDTYDTSPKSCGLLAFMDRGITVLIQDVVQLMNI